MAKESQPSARITGVDGDPKILEIARHKAEKKNIETIFDEALSYKLPYSSHQFDRALSSLFFHHLSWVDKQRTALEIFRVLKPGAELHVADWGSPSNIFMRALFVSIQVCDGFEMTRDNVSGRLIESTSF